MILALNVSSVKKAVSVDYESIRGAQAALTLNILESNPFKAEVLQVVGDSHEEWNIKKVKDFYAPESLDVLFIDGDHFNPKPDFMNFHSLLRPGGLLVWDDYLHHRVVKPTVNRMEWENQKCFQCIGSIPNPACAKNFDTGSCLSHSNEFICQKNWDCPADYVAV
ncbi:hypothetical protein B484DRAFT_483696 [Ochromonadaceae sp. CCMP2298]|nr:hypothetical protein B484DRAFT_483696 [Ochromonadaceae sp. CCMP2298]|mmetsp:Transcript_26165/g.57928  ORF Transcript_26165/g.57928 Transcript_26165/m.57928 type:complete len:165 (-) Transcript_26165:2198-2692(-)